MDILGINKEYIKSFDTYSNTYLDKELNKLPLLSFRVPKSMGKYFKLEGYIQLEGYGEFLIKEKKKSSGSYDIVAKPNMDVFFKDFYPNYTYTTTTIKAVIEPLLNAGGWTIECTDTKTATVTGKNKNTFEIILHALEVFEYEYIWDIKNKKLICGPIVGSDKGSYLHKEVNLRELNVTTQTYDFITRLIPKGKDDLGIEGVNNGIPYLEPTVKYSNKIIYGVWTDERYTIPENLKAAGQKLIDSLGKVYKSYEVDVIDLARLNSKYDYLAYDLGDTVTLVDNENDTREKQRIIGKKEYIREKLKDTVTISDSPLTITEIQQKIQSDLENKITVTRQYITVLEGEIKAKVSKTQILTDPEIQEILKGEEPILMIIKTSNGIIFKNNLINTVLTATLWQGGEEIDKDGSQFSYIWTKTDAYGNPDILWNQTHTYSSKSIAITQQDVFIRAQFECNIQPII